MNMGTCGGILSLGRSVRRRPDQLGAPRASLVEISCQKSCVGSISALRRSLEEFLAHVLATPSFSVQEFFKGITGKENVEIWGPKGPPPKVNFGPPIGGFWVAFWTPFLKFVFVILLVFVFVFACVFIFVVFALLFFVYVFDFFIISQPPARPKWPGRTTTRRSKGTRRTLEGGVVVLCMCFFMFLASTGPGAA